MYPEYEYKIEGLCSNECSCVTCRNARINDARYQQYLLTKWKHEAIIENKRTMENAIAHDTGTSRIFGHGNVNAVKFFQNLNLDNK